MSQAMLTHRPASDGRLSRMRLPSKARTDGLAIRAPGDAHEREADKVAKTVSAGGQVRGWSIARLGMGEVQRQPVPGQDSASQPSPQPDNYKEGAEKIGEAFLKTDVGRKLMQAVTDDPLVKAGESFLSSLPGKIITGVAAVGTVAGLAAEHKGLPIQIPAIPLDKVRPELKGVSVKITYEGPVDRPSKAMIVFSYTPGGDKKKHAQTDTDRTRAETARLTADRDQFNAGITYKAGTPEALQQEADRKATEDYTSQRFGSLPGTGGRPLVPPGPAAQQPDTGLHLPEFQSPFKPKTPTLLDKKLELKPVDAASSAPQPEGKREEIPVQRKAEGNAAVLEDHAGVEEALHSSGTSLDQETRSFMESRFGFDFSRVKIHNDTQAALSAREMGAAAYTVGNDIVFGPGRFAPETAEGKELIAHELTHTVQQERPAARTTGQILSTTPTHRKTHRGRGIPLSEAAANLGREQSRRTASTLAGGPVQFRVPTTADLKALFTSGNVPEAVLKDRIQLALTRMSEDKDRTLKTKDSIANIMKKIFPAPNVFDEAAYEAAVDVTNRSRVYQTVLDAEAKVTTGDKPKLKTVMGDSAKLIDECAADDKNLQSVFGTKKDVAKGVYVKAKAALNNAMANVDANITTDYNLDDPETGVGGWARFSDQHVHFRASVVKVTDEAKAKITIIHEACHLADATVKDQGYYDSPGFEGKSEDVKVANAAHYEEIPARKLGRSRFKRSDGTFLDFTVGTTAGGAQTFEDRVKEKAVEKFRKAWDKAVGVDGFIRDIRKAELAGNKAPFNAKKTRILELSRLMHLTVHEQPAATASINQVDVVLAEGVTRAMGRMIGIAKTQTVANPVALKVPPLTLTPPQGHPSVLNQHLQLKPIPGLGAPALTTEDEAAKKVVQDTITALGTLTGNATDDKALVDWLAAEYKKPL